MNELVKKNKDKMLGFKVTEDLHSKVIKFCEDRNWKLSRYLERAIIEDIERIEKKEKKEK